MSPLERSTKPSTDLITVLFPEEPIPIRHTGSFCSTAKEISFNNQKTLIEPGLIAGYNLSVEKTFKIFNGR